MPVRRAGLLRQQLRPGILRVIENEGNKLHHWFFRGIASRIGLADRRAGNHGAAAQQREEVGSEDETENQQNNRAADSDMRAADLESAASAAFIAAILDV